MRYFTWQTFLAVLMILGFAGKVAAQSHIEDEYQMKQYFMVFLKAGTNRGQDSATVVKIQAGHLSNIERLLNEKKMVMAGPFIDEGMYKGIFIFDVPTEKEVILLLSSDPAVESGRLDYEIHPWYGPGNIVILTKPGSR